ncbi:hypothetical protein K469DRAFT_687460 [Zopfia rhizophila CBS 207.26]|uniref:Uncharacterized protein n=1 Tax=Zopfia rhizophila CBS 207.26 TaxID=1314779 RepID=A0A6A6E4F3_9PEZI|nr:hypothetical protein K469DRAFT_687460 [Zopfia rhizophila CBS 207.26]
MDVILALFGKMDEPSRSEVLVQIASRADLTDFGIMERLLDSTQWTDSKFKPNLGEMELLWYAARREKHNEVRKLLERSAQDKPKEKRDWKALQWAAYLGNPKIVWWLLHAGGWEPKFVEEALRIAEEMVAGETMRSSNDPVPIKKSETSNSVSRIVAKEYGNATKRDAVKDKARNILAQAAINASKEESKRGRPLPTYYGHS